MTITTHKSKPLRGVVPIPGDKSISHRALFASAMGDGTSRIDGWLEAGDTLSTLKCLQDLGVDAEKEGNVLVIQGNPSRRFQQPSRPLDAGNSGTTMRLLSGILAGQPFRSVIGGDSSLSRRPMQRIIEPLTRMGANIQAGPDSTAPLSIVGKNPLHAMVYELPLASAQVKSAVLLAGLFADGETTVIEPWQTRDHTERILGLSSVNAGVVRQISVNPSLKIPAREYVIPTDVSSALFILGAALLITGSEIVLRNVGLNPTRTAAIDLLKELGARISTSEIRNSGGEPYGTIHARSSELAGECVINAPSVPLLIDEIPILAVISACAGIPFRIRGAAELRAKESDRISLMVRNLRSMNIEAEEYEDGFAFQGKNIVLPASIETGGDHRIAMAFGVAGCIVGGSMMIPKAESAEISFPGFWNILLRQ